MEGYERVVGKVSVRPGFFYRVMNGDVIEIDLKHPDYIRVASARMARRKAKRAAEIEEKVSKRITKIASLQEKKAVMEEQLRQLGI